MTTPLTQKKTEKNTLLLIGKQVRTNNSQEQGSLDGKIFPLVRDYYHKNFAENIPNRKSPGVTICAYTDYESDHTGDYTYFIGEEVTGFDKELPEGYVALTVPASTFIKFTSGPAPMPQVVTEPWQKIWEMNESDLGGKRLYHTDFEVYDERSKDHQNIVMDIFIGIES